MEKKINKTSLIQATDSFQLARKYKNVLFDNFEKEVP